MFQPKAKNQALEWEFVEKGIYSTLTLSPKQKNTGDGREALEDVVREVISTRPFIRIFHLLSEKCFGYYYIVAFILRYKITSLGASVYISVHLISKAFCTAKLPTANIVFFHWEFKEKHYEFRILKLSALLNL
jgi:hypothetical protein